MMQFATCHLIIIRLVSGTHDCLSPTYKNEMLEHDKPCSPFVHLVKTSITMNNKVRRYFISKLAGNEYILHIVFFERSVARCTRPLSHLKLVRVEWVLPPFSSQFIPTKSASFAGPQPDRSPFYATDICGSFILQQSTKLSRRFTPC